MTPPKALSAVSSRLTLPACAVLLAAAVTAASVATALPAAAADTDYRCEGLAQLGNDVLGLNCVATPGNPTHPVQLYFAGQGTPTYTCQTVTILTPGTVLGSSCQG